MTDRTDDAKILAIWAAALRPANVSAAARARLKHALDAEPHLPFCDELARCFALPPADMRALLARIVDPDAWTRVFPPVEAFIDFEPGPTLHPLRGGFLRLSSGAHLPAHRHLDRELTFVLEGELVDGAGHRYAPGSIIDMPVGSVHTLGVPEGSGALVALLHGRIQVPAQPE